MVDSGRRTTVVLAPSATFSAAATFTSVPLTSTMPTSPSWRTIRPSRKLASPMKSATNLFLGW